MSAKPRKILAFDWDSRSLRVVHAVVGKRGPKIDRLLSVAIPREADRANAQQMGELLRRVLDHEGISTSHAVVDIPRDQAILNTLSLPCQVPDALPNIVAIQIAKQLPFAIDDAVVDFIVGPHAPDAVTAEVLVAAVRHEVLAHYQAVFDAAKLKLIRIGLRPYANRLAACQLLRHAMPDRVLFIDVGPTLTEIDVLRNSFLAFSRAASVYVPAPGEEAQRSLGAEAVLNEEPGEEPRPAGLTLRLSSPTDGVVASLVVEVTRSIEAYRAVDAGAKMDHVVIGGDLGVEETLAEALQQRLNVTTEIYNPGSSFGWEPDEGANAAAFAATLGLVLGYAGEEALQFDFLHPKKLVSVVERRLKKAPLVAAVVVLFVAAAAVGLAAATKSDRRTLADLDRRISELRKAGKDNEKFLQIVKDVREFDADQQTWVDVLYDIVDHLPPQEELVINQIDFNQKDRRVVLKTRAKRRETATDVVRTLQAFVREGKTKPRFQAGMRGHVEKQGEAYPFVHDLLIDIQKDG